MAKRKYPHGASSRSWDPVAAWYTGWVGVEGSEHHLRVVIPTVLELLGNVRGEEILEIGCGPGVLAPRVAGLGARYTGVDSSRRLLAFARRHHGDNGRFILGDAARLDTLAGLRAASFDAAVFMLSIQDIDPLESALEKAAWSLRPDGRMILVMTHPCFRVPRQSGWGWDRKRRLRFRRVDRYLSPLDVPMKRYGDGRGEATWTHHRPLEAYANALAASGLLIERIREVTTHRTVAEGPTAKAERQADREIPLFLGFRAVKR